MAMNKGAQQDYDVMMGKKPSLSPAVVNNTKSSFNKSLTSVNALSETDRLQLKLKKFYDRMQMKQEESEFSLEKIFGNGDPKEISFLKKLDKFRKKDIDIRE